MVQLKDGITLIAKKKQQSLQIKIQWYVWFQYEKEWKKERKKRSILCDTKWKEAGLLEKAGYTYPTKRKQSIKQLYGECGWGFIWL
jgi:hypothetical protein